MIHIWHVNLLDWLPQSSQVSKDMSEPVMRTWLRASYKLYIYKMATTLVGTIKLISAAHIVSKLYCWGLETSLTLEVRISPTQLVAPFIEPILYNCVALLGCGMFESQHRCVAFQQTYDLSCLTNLVGRTSGISSQTANLYNPNVYKTAQLKIIQTTATCFHDVENHCE